eukprot:CAMPEP_0170480330 /NCGR_PEP_ID=MMETSP0208-20121228/1212_1 /TAXON_ID=197538 /ORGANISM="Strombidium inclinatum, Strain S3" /LENGTH=154 /DNA_ID=CAMNT_0010752861 /DNA_START=310 /DNA_END=771 /DNA_ORIENTATION=+
MQKFWLVQTELGGGKEIVFVCVLHLLLSDRAKFFYFLAVFSMDKVIMSYLKLAYHDPRPYMFSPNIEPISCSTGFGNPSGHSSASAVIALTLFLDTFHGYTHKSAISQKFYTSAAYYGWMLVGLYWAASIPFTRYLMGVHSLNQIVYGSSLGIW